MAKYEANHLVRYKPIGGPDSNTSESTGRIVKVMTEPENVTDRNIEASEDEPRYLIKNENTGKESAIKEANILEDLGE